MPEIYLTGKYSDINKLVTARIGQNFLINEHLPPKKQRFDVNLICYAIDEPWKYTPEDLYTEIKKLHEEFPCSQIHLIYRDELNGQFDEHFFNSFLTRYPTIEKNNISDFQIKCKEDEDLFNDKIEKHISNLWQRIQRLCNYEPLLISTLKARTIQLYKDLKYSLEEPDNLMSNYDKDCQEIIKTLKKKSLLSSLILNLSTAISLTAIAGFCAGFVVSARFCPKLAEGFLKHFLNFSAGILCGSSAALITKYGLSFFPSPLNESLQEAKSQVLSNLHDGETPRF
ncbi:MAG: hypothetical protein LCH30_10455 [Proteobacteria bacterium]|nr:hypothetical protein [Pseudomonadota bacterium]